MGVAFRDMPKENRSQIEAMIDTIRPAVPKAPTIDPQPEIHPTSMPIILNPGAALQALGDFFEEHTLLSKDQFFCLLRNSQGSRQHPTNPHLLM
jgi:hypothetical protein